MHAQQDGKKREIALIPVADLVRRWRKEFDIDVARYFEDADVISVRECADSGLICFEPSPIGDESLYSALGRFDWYYPEDKWEHRFSLSFVRAGARVLEVGCGRGSFLVKAKVIGAAVTGIELNDAAAEIAAQRSVDVVRCDVNETPPDWLRSFDLVVAFQVVEHVRDPWSFCARLFSFVKPGGALHIAVPNRDGFMRYTDTLLDLPPHHASRWNSRAMRYLGSRIGASRIRVVKGPLEPIHRDVYLQLLRRRLGALFINRISRPILRVSLDSGVRHFIAGHSIFGLYSR